MVVCSRETLSASWLRNTTPARALRTSAPYLIISSYFVGLFSAFGVHGGDLESCGGPNGYGVRGPAACPWFAGPLHTDPFHAAQAAYDVWTSRFFVELVEYALSHTLWLFVLVTIMLSWLFLWSVRDILEIHSSAGLSVFAALYWLSIPLQIHTSAGIYSTVISYSWTLFAGVFALAVLLRVHRQRPLRCVQRLAALPALLLALCSEQFVVLFIVVVASVLLSEIRRRPSQATVAYLLAAVAAVVNIVMSPGNRVRKQIEIDYWLPAFAHMSLADKLIAGFEHTVAFVVVAERPALIAAIVVTAAGLALRLRNRRHASALHPATAGVVTVLLVVHRMSSGGAVPEGWAFQLVVVAAFVVPVVMVGRRALKHDPVGGRIALVALAGGTSSAMLMSFSPTIWASSGRTLYFLLVSVVVVLFLVVRATYRELTSTVGSSVWTPTVTRVATD